jgi:hypothetical protein
MLAIANGCSSKGSVLDDSLLYILTLSVSFPFCTGPWHIRLAYYGVFPHHEFLEYPAYSLRFLLVICMPLQAFILLYC